MVPFLLIFGLTWLYSLVENLAEFTNVGIKVNAIIYNQKDKRGIQFKDKYWIRSSETVILSQFAKFMCENSGCIHFP